MSTTQNGFEKLKLEDPRGTSLRQARLDVINKHQKNQLNLITTDGSNQFPKFTLKKLQDSYTKLKVRYGSEDKYPRYD